MITEIPSIKFIVSENKKLIIKTSDDIFKDKNIVLFALPGAFTPTCTGGQLPSFEKNYTQLLKLNVDEVYCLSVNDVFVMEAWAKKTNTFKVKMLPDFNLNFTKAMDMIIDRSDIGLGLRSKRYSMYVQNKKIDKLFVDEDNKFNLSSGIKMVYYLMEKYK